MARVTRPLPPATFRPLLCECVCSALSLQATSGPGPFATLTPSRPRAANPVRSAGSPEGFCPVPGRSVQGADLQAKALQMSAERPPERASRTA
ncbi:unnamed protein product [Rangifer tarandus platyrhynchus]|uniref:Secreted protein n=1 Tax=Rangifer tarandus platyrhynchus TaxID=3082113 RepID=A0ABN8XRK7_RANTA|nr:unnamed protein product [Rangifer tarandus platyrhynchus]